MLSCFHICQSALSKVGRIVLSAAFLTVIASATLHATPITYDLTLTPGIGSTIGGSGSFTIESAPAASGISEYSLASSNLDALTFSVGGQTFSLAGDTAAFVEFLNGSLYDITFAQQLNGSSNNRYSLQTSGVYAFYYNNELSESAGTFTATQVPSTSPVPEPTSLALLATGLLGGAGSLYRRLSPRIQ